jgi:hypothetical protein
LRETDTQKNNRRVPDDDGLTLWSASCLAFASLALAGDGAVVGRRDTFFVEGTLLGVLIVAGSGLASLFEVDGLALKDDRPPPADDSDLLVDAL